MKFFSKVPLPFAGVALALASLGNLYKDSFPGARLTLGAMATLILVLVALKVVTNIHAASTEYENPVVASVAPTFSMALMVLASYVVPASPVAAQLVWFVGLILHGVLLCAYIATTLLPFNIKKIFASVFVPFVGIAVGAVTAPAVSQQPIGRILFWFGLVSLIVLLPVVLYRLFFVKDIPAPAAPTVMILAAPTALLLAGYLQSFDAKIPALVIGLGICGLVLYVLTFVMGLPLLLKKFVPSFAAFTFPTVINAIAFAGLTKYFAKTGLTCPGVPVVAPIMAIVAWVCCTAVLFLYIRFLLTSD